MEEKLSHQTLLANIAKAAEQIIIGSEYKHYKSPDTYKVIGLGILEATQKVCVMYQPQNSSDLTFLRPADEWLDNVEWEGSTVKRFTKL